MLCYVDPLDIIYPNDLLVLDLSSLQPATHIHIYEYDVCMYVCMCVCVCVCT